MKYYSGSVFCCRESGEDGEDCLIVIGEECRLHSGSPKDCPHYRKSKKAVLQEKVFALEAENERLREALGDIIRHQEFVCNGVQLGATWNIATAALRKPKEPGDERG